MRVAITSTDGVNVDQHFGKAKSFYVYDFKCGRMDFIEKRATPFSYSTESDFLEQGTDHSFEEGRLNAVFHVINDCQRLYTLKIGERPRQALEALGMEVRPCHCPIETLSSCSGNCTS